MDIEKVHVSLLKNGDKVILDAPDLNYSIGKRNPVTGSEWECFGTVCRDTGFDDTYIRVVWNNDEENSYKGWELSLVKPGTNTKVLKCKSIW